MGCWAAFACVCAILTARSADAQELCKATETVTACLLRLDEPELKAAPKAAAETKAQTDKTVAEVKKKTETGLQDLNGLASSLKDFLPLLQMNGLVGALKKDETTGTVSIALNTRFLGSGGLTEDPSLQLKAVFETKPKLFDELKRKLPAGTRDAMEKSLLGSKVGAEHSTLFASYNATSDRLGRNFARHMKLYNVLVREAVAGPTKALVITESALIRKLTVALGDLSMDETKWADIPEARRAVVLPLITQIYEAHLALRTAFADAVKSTGVDLFGQLVNNQPQLTIMVSTAFRDDLFGPNLFSGRVAFEMGLSDNLNGFLKRFDHRECTSKPGECLKEFASYAGRPETKANLKAASRLAAYVEFIHTADYRYTNAEAALNVAFAAGTTWSAGLDYGTLFGVSETGAADGRVDASLRFERRSNAPDETRLVSSVVLTKKIGDISIPFGIVYANKPRFLTGVDKGITSTVGLKFNLFPGSK